MSKESPSFELRWAPAFDLGLYKLPFFIDPKSPLDLETEPDEEKVKAIKLELSAEDQKAYREVFRTGGKLVINPKVTENADGKAETIEAILMYYRLIVGEPSAGGEKRRIVVVEPGEEGSEGYAIEVPAPPNASGPTTKIPINPEVHVHPDIRKLLITTWEACQELQKATRTSANVKGDHDRADQQFAKLGWEFVEVALHHFCQAKQEDLVSKRKELVQTLTEMPRFVATTGDSWKRIGGAVELHRAAFKRMEENLINAYYDLLLFGPIKRFLETKVIARFPPRVQQELNGLLAVHSIAKLPLEKVVSHLNKSFVGQFARNFIERCLVGAKEKLKTAISNLQALAGRRSQAIQALERTETAYASHINKFSTQVDQLADVTGRIEAMVAARGEDTPEFRQVLRTLQQERRTLQTQLAATVRETGAAHRAHREAFNQRIVLETQYRAEEARLKSLHEVQKHFVDRGEEARELAGKEVSQKEAEELLAKLHENPVAMRSIGEEASQAGQQEMQSAFSSYSSQNQTLAAKAAYLEQNSPRLLGRDLTGSRVSAGLPTMTPGNLESIGPAARNATQEAETLLLSANNRINDQTVKAVYQTVASINAINSGTMGDALKSGSHVIANEVERFTKGLPPPPPAQGGIGDGWGDWITSKVIDVLIYWYTHSGKEMMMDSAVAFLRVVVFLLRVLFFPINFLFRVTARLLAKMMEMLIGVINAVRELPLFERTSTLQKPAIQAGLAALEKCGAKVDDYFDFPYFRQQNLFDKCIEAERQFRTSTDPLDKGVEQILETAMSSGFEDYYPSQMRSTRQIFFQLCSQVLSKETLETAPCEPKESSWKSVMRAQQALEQQMDQYQNAFKSAGGDDKALLGGGFFNSLVDLYQDLGSWTSKHWDTFIDWIAWIIGVICMAVALAFAIMAVVDGLISSLVGGGGAVAIGVLIAESLWALRVVEISAPIAATLRLAAAGVYFYPYSTGYPRDLMLTQAIYYAAVFRPSGERFPVSSEGDIVYGMKKKNNP